MTERIDFSASLEMTPIGRDFQQVTHHTRLDSCLRPDQLHRDVAMLLSDQLHRDVAMLHIDYRGVCILR